MTAIPTLCSHCGGRHDMLAYHVGWPPKLRPVPNRVLLTRAQVAAAYPKTVEHRQWRFRINPTRAEEET